MNNFIFENATKVYFGKGCVKEYLTCLTKGYGDTIMLAYGGGSIKRNGVYEEVADILNSAGRKLIEFPDIRSDSTYGKVLEGAELAREHNAGLILGVGGGSVIDCCKAISIAARYDGDVWEDFWARPGIFDFEPLPLGVIATAGTGSECNGVAFITNQELKIKTGRDYPQCNPRFALLDPTYTYSVPKEQMVSSAFEVFCEMMETYFSEPDEDNVSDDIAEALMRNVVRNLYTAIENPHDYTARSNLVWAAVMAENRIIKLGKLKGSPCRRMEYQCSASASQDRRMKARQPVYCRQIYRNRLAKFKKFAVNVWGIGAQGMEDEEAALAGIEAMEEFMDKIGVGVDDVFITN